MARFTRDLLNTLTVITAGKAGSGPLAKSWPKLPGRMGRLTLMVLGRLAEFERDHDQTNPNSTQSDDYGTMGTWRVNQRAYSDISAF